MQRDQVLDDTYPGQQQQQQQQDRTGMTKPWQTDQQGDGYEHKSPPSGAPTSAIAQGASQDGGFHRGGAGATTNTQTQPSDLYPEHGGQLGSSGRAGMAHGGTTGMSGDQYMGEGGLTGTGRDAGTNVMYDEDYNSGSSESQTHRSAGGGAGTRIMGNMEKAAGKLTRNEGMVERGEARKVGQQNDTL